MHPLPRRTGTASLATLAAFAGAFALIQLFAPTWAHDVGLDVWTIDDDVQNCRLQNQREKDLGEGMQDLNHQINACDAVVDALIADRMSLSTAASQIDAITRDRPGFVEVLGFVHHGVETHRLRVARYTIGKVQTSLEQDPSRREAVLARLEAEYRKLGR